MASVESSGSGDGGGGVHDPQAPVTRGEFHELVRHVASLSQDDEDLLIHDGGGDHIAENWRPENTTQWIEAVDRTDARDHKEKMTQMTYWVVCILAAFVLIGVLVSLGHGALVVTVAPHLVSLVAGFAGGYGYARSRRPGSD